MKTQHLLKTLVLIASLTLANTSYAHGDHISNHSLESNQVTEVVYDNPAYNRGIHSYPNLLTAQPIEEAVIYVKKAYGQAIYSYPHNQ